jgi:hypothetical protein
LEGLILWGTKNQAFFDWWSLEHYFSGLSLGAFIYIFINKMLIRKEINITKSDNIKIQFVVLLALNYMWEALEHYLEEGVAGEAVAYWFYGVEHVLNRMVSDPLMVMLGWATIMLYFKYIQKNDYNKKSWLLIFLRVFTISWLAVHIFVFPHSMYLHEIWF